MVQIKKYVPKEQKVKALIYGKSGTGKTFFGGTAPKPLFAAAEDGLLSVKDKGVSYAKIKTKKDLIDLFDFLKNTVHDFETIIIDSITEINEIIKAGIEEENKRSIQRADWMIVQKDIKKIFRSFGSLNMHVIIIAQEKHVGDEDKILRIMPSLNGKSSEEICYWTDIVAYSFIDKEGKHGIMTTPHEKLATKCRGDFLKEADPLNFASWVKALEFKPTKEKVISEHEVETKKEVEKKELPQPTKEEIKESTAPSKETKAPFKESTTKTAMATAKQKTAMFAAWSEVYELKRILVPDQCLPEAKDATRKATIEKLYGVDSSTKMTKQNAIDFMEWMKAGTQKLQVKVDKKLEDAKKEKEANELATAEDFNFDETKDPFKE